MEEVAQWTARAAQHVQSASDTTPLDEAAEGDTSLTDAAAQGSRIRMSAYDWIAALGHGLITTAGKGLFFWCQKQAHAEDDTVHKDRKAPADAVLTWTAGQGSDGYAASWFLLDYMKCQAVRLDDPSHRIQNDIKLALQDSPVLYDQLLLNGVAYNAHWGPYQSGAWWEQIQEATERYFRLASAEDPLFVHLMPRIARDRGLAHRLHEPGFGDQLLKQLKAPMDHRRKGPRLQYSRFMARTDCADAWDPLWNTRLLILILVFMGLEAGYLDNAKTKVGSTVAKRKVLKDTPRSTTQAANEKVQNLRSETHNTLHLATWIMYDEAQQLAGRVIGTMAAPLRLWHGLQAKGNRGSKSKEFYVQCAEGPWLQHVNQTFTKLFNLEALQHMSVEVDMSSSLIPPKPGDPTILEEDVGIEVIAGFAFSLARHRCRGMLAHTHSYPEQFARLLSSDAAKVRGTLCLMKDTHAATTHARQLNYTKVNKLLERSVFQQVPVERVFCLASQWL